MARVKDALLGSTGIGKRSIRPMLDPAYGGQQGYAPVLHEWVSNQAYIRQNVICVLLEAPKFFNLMNDPTSWIASLKAIMELHAKKIDGLDASLTVETVGHRVGGTNDEQKEVVRTNQAQTEVKFTWVEKYGEPIGRLLTDWIEYGLSHPETQMAAIGTNGENFPSDMLADWYSCSCMFIEPDVTGRKVHKSWVVVNMFPLSNGETIGSRDLEASKQLKEMEINFGGIPQFNRGTDVVAQNILEQITYDRANPSLSPSIIQEISPEVDSVERGYMQGIKNVSETAIELP